MRMGFVFNIRFPYYQGNYYAIDLPGEIWKNRYLKYCDEIVVIGRKDPVNETPSSRLAISNIEHVAFSCVENESYFWRLLHHRKDSHHVLQEISKCDFVVCRGSWGANECRKLGIPYLVEVVGCDWDALWNHSWQGKVAALPRFLALRRAVRNAPYVLYVTKKFLQKRYPTNGIHAGISDVKLNQLDDRVLSRRLAKISQMSPQSRLIIGTTAAVNVKYKGQQFVIMALSKLKKKGFTNIEYQLVGGGNVDYLKNVAREYGVSDQVVFKGALPHSEVFEWLDTIDVYIQPSLQEGLPRAVVEAMSRACPVIGARTGGIPELLNSNYIFKRKDAGQIAGMIKSLNKNNMIQQAKHSFAKAAEFDLIQLDQERDSFYRSFLDAHEQLRKTRGEKSCY